MYQPRGNGICTWCGRKGRRLYYVSPSGEWTDTTGPRFWICERCADLGRTAAKVAMMEPNRHDGAHERRRKEELRRREQERSRMVMRDHLAHGNVAGVASENQFNGHPLRVVHKDGWLYPHLPRPEL